MIPVAWLAAAGLVGLIGGGAYYVYTHWDEILNWLASFLPKVANLIREIGRHLGPATEYLTEIIAKKIDEVAIRIEHHLFYKQYGKWIEEATPKVTKYDTTPPSVKRKMNKVKTIGEEVDITDEIEAEGLTV